MTKEKAKELLAQVKESKKGNKPRRVKEIKIAKPAGGVEALTALINQTTSDEPIEKPDENVKLEFVGGQWVAVPVVDVAEEVAQLAEELATKEPVEEPMERAVADALAGMPTIVELSNGVIVQLPAPNEYALGEEIPELKEVAEELLPVVKPELPSLEELEVMVAELEEQVKDMPSQEEVDEEMRFINTEKRRLKMLTQDLQNQVDALEEEVGAELDKQYDKEHPFKSFIQKYAKYFPSIMMIVGAIIACIAVFAITDPNYLTAPSEQPRHDTVAKEEAQKLWEGDKVVIDQWNAMRGPSLFGPTVSFPVTKPGTVATDKVVVAHNPISKPIIGKHVASDFASLSNAKSVVSPVPVVPVSSTVSYTVKSGDTLWDVAVKVYGDGSQWTKVWDANKDALTKADSRNATDAGHWIHVGQVIQVSDGSLNDH